MLKPVSMLWLRAVVLERDERRVLEALGAMGVLHIARAKANGGSDELAPPDRSKELAHCARIRDRAADLRRLLDLPPTTGCSKESALLSFDACESILTRLEDQLAALEKGQNAAAKQRDQAITLLEQMTSFQGVDLPFEQLETFSFLHFAIGSLPTKAVESLREKVDNNVLLLPLKERGERNTIVAITSRTGRFALETALQECKFQSEKPAAADGKALATLIAAGKRQQQILEAEIKQNAAERHQMAQTAAPQLAAIEQFINAEERIIHAEASFARTDSTLLITGWVPANDTEAVATRINQTTGGACVVETRTPDELPHDKVPVLLRHPRLLRPFQMLVAGYGMPNYNELEPTLFVAITYMLMFGMMFGDVGHGGVLLVGGLLAIFLGRKPKVRDVGVLLSMAGAASIGFGFIYGSCFGLHSFSKYALWHEPLDGNPLELMLVAIGLGVVVISVGIILNIVNRFRKGDWMGGFLDGFGVVGALFYWGMLGLLLKFTALRAQGLLLPTLLVVVGIPLVGWALREPLKHALDKRAQRQPRSSGYFEATMESLVEAFETVLSYMANTISFVRLAAYAMSHAAVLMATMVLATEMRKMSSGGTISSLLVIIAGNLIAILLEGIIAAVQALRLEYYEFFGKFFAGDGLPFEPFKLDGEGE